MGKKKQNFRTALEMSAEMIRHHKQATKQRGCSWSQCVREVQRDLVKIMREPDRNGDGPLLTSAALLNALPMIKGAVGRDVYEVAARAAALLQYLAMDASRPAPPRMVFTPTSAMVH